jgi:hypothetical protein
MLADVLASGESPALRMAPAAEAVPDGLAALDLLVASLKPQVRHRRAAQGLLVEPRGGGGADQDQCQRQEIGGSYAHPSKEQALDGPQAKAEPREQPSGGEQRRKHDEIMHVVLSGCDRFETNGLEEVSIRFDARRYKDISIPQIQVSDVTMFATSLPQTAHSAPLLLLHHGAESDVTIA